MIGKMYRPTKITVLHSKRGFHFQHKYKSNFAGIHEFEHDVYLHFENGEEVIHMELNNLIVPVVMDREAFVAESADEVRSRVTKKKVETLREITRPAKEQMSSSNDRLKVQMLIKSERNPDENELLEVVMKPVVIDNQEFFLLEATADTQINVVVNTTVKLIER
ncbi:hypothetical protein ACFVS2_21860 [Brevibacillus sp. NPDC058079]|uniref:hypothetical protein n=1 Tax=Brevibacillus sp. NPDC058079 TaxID=3346330 RepID=UPI0036E583C9